MIYVHEIHTLVAEELDVTVVVFANHDHAIISEEASRNYGHEERAYGWNDAPIDFVALARSIGLDAIRAENSDALADALTAAREDDGPTLVEVPTDPLEPQANEWMRPNQ